MGGLRLSFEFFGDQQVDRTLTRFGENVRDARPVWNDLADDFARSEARQFSSGGRYASGGWSPLSPKYAAWKALRFPGQPILVATGDLRASLTRRPLGVEAIEPQSMAIGSDVEHGGYHQRGDGVPQRRPVELTEARRRDWVRRLQKHIVSTD